MTGNELNYAFQHTVSPEYTFGSDDKLIDSFPSWPKMKHFFNPYNLVSMSYAVDEPLNILQGALLYKLIPKSGIDTSFGTSKHEYNNVKLRVCARPDFIDVSSPFYYNGKEYRGLEVLFNVKINNIGNKSTSLVFKGGDMKYDDDIKRFVYEEAIVIRGDGVKRRLYYSPENYMKLHTSNGDDVTLNNSAAQLYTYI